MEPSSIATLLTSLASRETYKAAKKTWTKLKHDGYERAGTARIVDSQDDEWQVKIRRSGKRGRFLRIERKRPKGEEFLACAGHKPEKYLQITSEEWEAFYLFAYREDHHDQEWVGHIEQRDLYACVKGILARLAASSESGAENREGARA